MEYRLSPEERNIASLVQMSASELRPTDDYKLSLYGLTVPRDFKRTLERQFDIPIHRDLGADVMLTTDKTTGDLYAKVISIPTSKKGKAHLYHTEQLGYIPSLDRNASLPIRDYSKEDIMEMLSIDKPSSTDLNAYHVWKSDLLRESEAWELEESVEMIDHIVNNTGFSVRIQGNEYVGAPGQETYRKTMAVSRNISSRLDDSREQISSFSAEVELNNYDTALRAISSFCIKRASDDLISILEEEPEFIMHEVKDTRDKDVLNGARTLGEKALEMLREKYND